MSLEYVVRPFASKKVTPPTRLVEGEKAVTDAVVAIGGGDGWVQKWSLFMAEDFETKPSDSYKEIERKTSTIRVRNVDDPEIYVDVERVDSMKLKNIYDPKKFREYEFDNPPGEEV